MMSASHSNGYQEYNSFDDKQMIDDQLNSINTLLVEISNDSKWHKLTIELKQYKLHLKQEQEREREPEPEQNYPPHTDTARPTKPPMRLKHISMAKESSSNSNKNKNNNFPTKPPMRLKQSQSQQPQMKPLLRLFVIKPQRQRYRSQTIETLEIVIWNTNHKEIEHVVHKLCDENHELREYSKAIKNTVLDLIK